MNYNWLVFANKSKCNHAKALHELGYISWRQDRVRFAIGDIVYLIHQAAIIEDILVGFDIVKVRYLHNFDEFYTDISAISLMPNIEINTLDINLFVEV